MKSWRTMISLLAFSLLGAALAPAFAVTTASELTHKDASNTEQREAGSSNLTAYENFDLHVVTEDIATSLAFPKQVVFQQHL